ncbi:MAG: hypothetical protein CM15mP113_0270 [Pseudomonadota bacterium]|nr:MAG: hypothetical protein CM15mP113_0270 [Pseudomonadota bacterium]
MALNLASPGIQVREVDLTIGRVDATSGSIGALVAPFTKGPVEEPQLIESEEDLLQTFGQPYSVDKHYEYWMVASSYLAYGGTMQVVRANDAGLNNAVISSGISSTYTGIKIKSDTHYNQLGYDENVIAGIEYVAKHRSYANGIKVATIDSKSDQIITGIAGTTLSGVGHATGNSVVGYAITQTAYGRTKADATGTTTLDGYIKGIVTKQVSETALELKILSHVASNGTETAVDYTQGGIYNFTATGAIGLTTTGQQITTNGVGFSTISAGTVTYTQQQDWFCTTEHRTFSWNIRMDQLSDKPVLQHMLLQEAVDLMRFTLL